MKRGYDAHGARSSSETADRVVREDEFARTSSGAATVGGDVSYRKDPNGVQLEATTDDGEDDARARAHREARTQAGEGRGAEGGGERATGGGDADPGGRGGDAGRVTPKGA